MLLAFNSVVQLVQRAIYMYLYVHAKITAHVCFQRYRTLQ